MADEFAGVAGEDLDEVPLGRPEAHFAIRGRDALCREVDGEVVGLDNRVFLGGRGSSERGSEAREEFVHAEGFGDVVVGAGVENADLVALGLAHGEDDDRYGGTAAQAADDCDAVVPGESQVEDDEIGVFPGGECQRCLTGLGELRRRSRGRGGWLRARAGSAARRRRRGSASLGGVQSRDDGEPAAWGVVYLDLAAHRLEEALRDC